MRTVIRKPLLLLLAAIFMLEAWLWDITGAAIYRLLGWIPRERLKAAISRSLMGLSPWLTLCIFIIPVLILLPLKILTLWLLTHDHLFAAVGMALMAKLAGLGVSSFLFSLCKPKLMQLRFVAWLYRRCIIWRARAVAAILPYRIAFAQWRATLPTTKILEKWRLRMHTMRQHFHTRRKHRL